MTDSIDRILGYLGQRIDQAEKLFGRLHGAASMLDGLSPNQVGQQRDLLFADHAFEFLEIITTRSGDSTNTRVCTVTVGVDVPPEIPEPPGRDLQLVGKILWGIGGAGQHTAFFDWRNGAQLSMPASSMTIQVRHATGSVPPPRVACRATIGWYPRGGRSLVTSELDRRIVPAVAFAVPGSTVYIVPPFTYSVQVHGPVLFPLFAATTLLIFHGGTTAASAILGVVNGIDLRAAQRNGEGIRLPAGTHSIEIQNFAAVPLTVQPTFGTVL